VVERARFLVEPDVGRRRPGLGSRADHVVVDAAGIAELRVVEDPPQLEAGRVEPLPLQVIADVVPREGEDGEVDRRLGPGDLVADGPHHAVRRAEEDAHGRTLHPGALRRVGGLVRAEAAERRVRGVRIGAPHLVELDGVDLRERGVLDGDDVLGVGVRARARDVVRAGPEPVIGIVRRTVTVVEDEELVVHETVPVVRAEGVVDDRDPGGLQALDLVLVTGAVAIVVDEAHGHPALLGGDERVGHAGEVEGVDAGVDGILRRVDPLDQLAGKVH